MKFTRKKFAGALIFLALFFCALWFFYDEKNDSAPRGLTIADLGDFPQLAELDVILREGVDLDSVVISKISQSPWTHVGIVVSSNPVEIIHASTTDTANRVAKSTFADFLKNAERIAVKRYDLSPEKKAAILENLKAQVGKNFSFNQDAPLYCTTLLENAFGREFLNLEYQNISAPVLGGEYLLPSAFYDDKKSVLIFENFSKKKN